MTYAFFDVINQFTDRPGLVGVGTIEELNNKVMKALNYELSKTPRMPYKGDVTFFDALNVKIPSLRELSMLHMEALSKFLRSSPNVVFPPLHRELFSVDFMTNH